MPDPSPSTLTVLTPTSYSSEEGVAAGHSGQFTPMRLPVNTVIHATLVGLEPTTFRLICWSDALPVVPPTHQEDQSWGLRGRGRGPNSCAKGPSVDRAPNDYAATCHKVSNTLTTLRGPPYRGDQLLQRVFSELFL